MEPLCNKTSQFYDQNILRPRKEFFVCRKSEIIETSIKTIACFSYGQLKRASRKPQNSKCISWNLSPKKVVANCESSKDSANAVVKYSSIFRWVSLLCNSTDFVLTSCQANWNMQKAKLTKLVFTTFDKNKIFFLFITAVF